MRQKDGGFVVQGAHIDCSEVARLVEKLTKAPQVLKEAKRQAFESAAPRLLSAVQFEIGGSGRVRSWQEKYVGSKGGYAAARPKAETYLETKGKQKGFRAGPKKYAVGYVTNAINNGHRSPKNQRGHRTSGKVTAGKPFYQRAQKAADQVAQDTAEQIVQALIDHLEE